MLTKRRPCAATAGVAALATAKLLRSSRSLRRCRPGTMGLSLVSQMPQNVPHLQALHIIAMLLYFDAIA